MVNRDVHLRSIRGFSLARRRGLGVIQNFEVVLLLLDLRLSVRFCECLVIIFFLAVFLKNVLGY